MESVECRMLVVVLVMATLLPVGSVHAAESLELVDVAETLEPIRQEYDFPALAAAVILDGRLHALGVTGVRKHGADVAVLPDDAFHLGSCTKAMTASLVCLLVDEGKLDWTTTLAEYFPEFKDRMAPDYQAVTLVHLLSHRAGLPSMTAGFAPVPRAQLSKIGKLTPRQQRYRVTDIVLREAPLHKPGEQYLYSNAGYTVAGAILESVTDIAWEDLIRMRLFDPLGMKTAGFGAMGTPDQLDAPWPHKYADGRLIPISPGPAGDNPPFLGRADASTARWPIGPAISPACSRPAEGKRASCRRHSTTSSRPPLSTGPMRWAGRPVNAPGAAAGC